MKLHHLVEGAFESEPRGHDTPEEDIELNDYNNVMTTQPVILIGTQA